MNHQNENMGPGHMPHDLDLGFGAFEPTGGGSSLDMQPALDQGSINLDTRPPGDFKPAVSFQRPPSAPHDSIRRSKRTKPPQAQVVNLADILNGSGAPAPAPTPLPQVIPQPLPVIQPEEPKEVALQDKPISQLTPQEREERFNLAMAELRHLQEKGCQTTRGFGYDANLEDLEREVARLKAQRKKDLWIRDMNRGVIALASFTEKMNKRYNPFGLDLDGFGENTLENIEEFDDIHRDLYDKYLTEVDYPPEVRWVKAFVAGALTYSQERSKIMQEGGAQPKIQDEMAEVLNYRPDLRGAFQEAAAELREQHTMGMHSMPLRAPPPQAPLEPTIPFPPEAYRPTNEPPAPQKRKTVRKTQSRKPKPPAHDTDDEEQIELNLIPNSLRSLQQPVQRRVKISEKPPQEEPMNMSEAESLTDLLN